MPFLILLLLFGCLDSNGSKQPFNPQKEVYKRDMVVNGYVGVGVLPYDQIYTIHAESMNKLSVFQMTTCHTEETKERAWNIKQTVRSGLFGWGRKTIDKENEVEFQYKPTQIESDGLCHMELQSFELGGDMSFAIIDFANPFFQLTSYDQCNGRTEKTGLGTTICQARYDTTQGIAFDEIVDVDTEENCGVVAGKKVIEYKMPLDRCVVIFKGRETGKFHKHTMFGYNKTRIRQ